MSPCLETIGDIAKRPPVPGINLWYKCGRRSLRKKDLAQFIFNELYAMVVCVEYSFCDKCVTAD